MTVLEIRCKELTVRETAEFLKNHDNFIILTHASPDGDTIGSGYALMQILEQSGKKAAVILSDYMPPKYDYIKKENTLDFEPQTVVAVDVADTVLLDGDCKKYEKIDLCIDHHPSNTHYAEYLYLEDKASACCEAIYHLAREMSAQITDDIANALYTGIATDSGCFKFSSVSAETHRIAAELIEKGANHAEINRRMFETNSKERLAIEQAALSTLSYHFGGRCAVMCITNDMIKASHCVNEDLDGIASIPRTVEGVLIGVTIIEKKKGIFKASFRTHRPANAGEMAALLGGGGHFCAASCKMRGDIEEIKMRVLQTVESALENIR